MDEKATVLAGKLPRSFLHEHGFNDEEIKMISNWFHCIEH